MNSPIKILIAEDDLNIRQGLVDALEMAGYEVREAPDGSETLRLYAQWRPDLLLLDVMMPKLSGFDVCRQIRNGNPTLPIIMLTAKGEEIDKVLGLELGADDYVTKPFSLRELLARIHAILRRSRPPETPKAPPDGRFAFGDLQIEPDRLAGRRPDGSSIDFSKREIELLRCFAAHPDTVLDRQTLLSAAWEVNYGGFSRTLDQHIAQLRKKLPEQLIETVYGIGYRYVSRHS